MASRVGSVLRTSKRRGSSLITWCQFGREGGSRVLEGRLTGWCNSRVRWRMPGSNVQALQGLTEGYFRLAPTRLRLTLFVGPAQLAKAVRASRRSAAWCVG
eukprot:scaffold45861_cov94-Phaeocystis_antarctica.AAC.1